MWFRSYIWPINFSCLSATQRPAPSDTVWIRVKKHARGSRASVTTPPKVVDWGWGGVSINECGSQRSERERRNSGDAIADETRVTAGRR